jgi:hypothetical protein
MSEDLRVHQAPRARPVAGLPIEAVRSRADELARRWAISLVLARPLGGFGEIPLEDLAREAPGLCAQALLALESELELDRLTGRGTDGREQGAPARRLAAISGARDAPALVEAVEALRGVLWEGLLEELRWPTFDQSHARGVADASDRLAYVCASALAGAIAAVLAAEPPDDAGASAPADAVTGGETERPPAPAQRAVIVDERAPVPAAPRRSQAEIEIRDERGEGPAAWIGSIGRELERFRQDGLAFAVLLVELRDLERLRRDSLPAVLTRLTGDVERALADELAPAPDAPGGGASWRSRPSGSLTRESPGRYWLVVAETDRDGARTLAGRLADAVARLAVVHWAPLEVAIGTAVCPEDGREAAALAAHADLELYAERSSARTTTDEPA